MPTKTLTAKVRSKSSWTYTNRDDMSGPTDVGVMEPTTNFTSGTGALEVNAMWRARRLITHATTTDDLDLYGGLTDSFGVSLSFSVIKYIAIENKGTPNAAGTAWTISPGQDILIGGAGAAGNAWAPWANDNKDAEMRLRAGGMFVMSAPSEGWNVGAGSDDILRLLWDGSVASGGDTDVDIVIMGIAS